MYYSGNECPLCREERTANYVKKFGKNEDGIKEHFLKGRDINEADIAKLRMKFNSKAVK